VNAKKFAALFAPVQRAADGTMAAMTRAVEVLRAVEARGDEMFVVEVRPHARLGAAVDAALAVAGQAFGATIVSELVRGGAYVADRHERLLDATAFRNWTGAERRFAPPLVVVLDGAALVASELAPFTDGREKLVLVTRGATPPAALARCITPGTFVVQTANGAGLERLAAFDGPAIGALVPEGAATFVHDPARGRESWQRLTVQQFGEAPRKAIGTMSAWQMNEDMELLETLAKTPFAVPAPGGGAAAPAMGASDAADRIAHWLLSEAGLPTGPG
jgi:hypothetical protein